MCCRSSEGVVLQGEWVSLAKRVGLKKGHKWLLIKFCAFQLQHAPGCSRGVSKCLTVTKRDDGRRPETVTAIKGVIVFEHGVCVFLWFSTPRTGGCPYQRMHLQKQGSANKGYLNGLWNCHMRLWSNFVSLTRYTHGWAIEWPARCAYWSWG